MQTDSVNLTYPQGFRTDPVFGLTPNFGMTNELRGVEKKNGESISTFSASVPRPAFEIYKLGTILLNRKSKKNKALYTNIQYITNTHLVNSI